MLRGLLQQARWKCSGHAVEAHHQQMSTAQSAGGNTSSATCIDVQRFLRAHGVDVSRFQRPVHDLQLEADRAEAHFELDPSTGRPVRYIEVVRLLIRAQETGLYLIERHQRFSDGLQRSRNIAPSEKLLQGEALEQAARRALAEELSHAASTSARLFTDDSLHSTTKKIQSSRSYPGLTTSYLFHNLPVEVTQAELPTLQDTFETVEHAENGKTITSTWAWVSSIPDLR